MVSLLVTVFVIQLICHLVLTIGSKPINDLLWHLYTLLPLSSSKDISEQTRLRREVVRLKREMNAISAQDEFSKWAKFRRQHDKALEEYDRKAAKVTTTRQTFDQRASMLRWLSTSGLRFGLQFWHAKTPVFTYPRGWFPWYIEWILGFPRCPYGGVSINVWSTACATVIGLVSEVLVWGMGYVLGKVKVTEKQEQQEKGRRKVSIPRAEEVD